MLPSILFPEKMARLTMIASVRVLDVAVGGGVGRCGEDIHRRQRRTALALQVREPAWALASALRTRIASSLSPSSEPAIS